MRTGLALEIADPKGAIEVNQLHAPHLSSLGTAAIAELYNGSWEHARTFAVISKLLKQRYLCTGTIVVTSEDDDLLQ